MDMACVTSKMGAYLILTSISLRTEIDLNGVCLALKKS
jgi:hypothetical protein